MKSLADMINEIPENLQPKLDEFKTGIVPVVKSVQYGMRAAESNCYNSNSYLSVKVTISEVNIEKSIIILNGSTSSNSYSGIDWFVSSKSSTYFYVSNYQFVTADRFSWQVIEFY